MALGVWLWKYGFVHRVLGVWFGFEYLVLGVWLWAYSVEVRFWAYDFGGTVLQTRAGQAQKYIPILNRKINH